MKFKCNISGCVYNFESELDIKAMKMSQDYTVVPSEAPVESEKPNDPVGPATITVATPKPVAPIKPLPATPVAAKAV